MNSLCGQRWGRFATKAGCSHSCKRGVVCRGMGKLQTEISQASWTPVNAHGLVDCKWHDEMVRFAPPHRCNSAHKSVGCKCVAHTLFCQHKSAFEKEAV